MKALSGTYRLADGRMSMAIKTINECLDAIAAIEMHLVDANLSIDRQMEDRMRGAAVDEDALHRLRREAREMQATKKALRQAIEDERRAPPRRAASKPVDDAEHARRMERIAASKMATAMDLEAFKEEVKRRVSAEEYASLWRAVRDRSAPAAGAAA